MPQMQISALIFSYYSTVMITIVSSLYQILRSKLNILRMPTNQLIVHFYSELMKHQREETGKGGGLGEMIVSVGYIKEVSAIEVIVVQARDIGKSTILKLILQNSSYGILNMLA